jgi:hypothetical protein
VKLTPRGELVADILTILAGAAALASWAFILYLIA